MVDLVVGGIFLDVCGPQEALHGLGWVVGVKYMVLYSNIWLNLGQEPDIGTGYVEDICVYV